MWNWWKKGHSAPDEPSRDECRAALLALLEQVEQGMTWEQAQPFLQNQGVTSQHLAQWLERYGGDLVREPDLHTGQQLLQLGQTTEGDLSKFSRLIGNAIVQKLAQPVVNQSEPSGGTTNVEISSSVEKQSSIHGDVDEGQTSPNNQEASASDDAVQYFNQGNQLFMLGRHEEAIASYDQALKIKPDMHNAWLNRGSALVNLGRYEEAIANCDQALKVKPDDHDAWANRGLALLKLGRYEEAIASYDQVLKVKLDDHEAWLNRGVAFWKLSRYEEAIASCDQALKVKPDFHDAWANRGRALEYLGRYEEAIASYDQVLKVKPDDHEAWNDRGVAAQQSPGYDSQANQSLVDDLTFSSINERQRLLVSFNFDDEILLTTLLANPAPLLVHFENVEPLYHFIQQPAPPTLQALIQQELSPSLVQFIQTISSPQLLQYLQQEIEIPEALNERGYQGALNSYQAELGEHSQDEPRKAICKDTHPEGWGKLHRKIGQTHYRESRRQKYPHAYWRRAEHHFKLALEVLCPPDFDELYLDVLQELIQVLTDLDEYDAARKLNQDGRDWIENWLQEPNRDADQKKRLGLKQARFTQLTVNFALQQGNVFEALQLAEFAKNVCLRWLLDLGDVPEVTFQQIQSLLSPNTAAIYWHLSPVALTTFLLLPGADAPILIPPLSRTPSNDEADQRSLHLRQLLDWETWLTQWNQRYESDYMSQTETSDPKTVDSSIWHQQLPQQLDELSQILNVAAVQATLRDANINQLILIPHRDLHRLPLHQFFEDYICSYLPTAQLGLSWQSLSTDQPQLSSLLLVENPQSKSASQFKKKKLAPLPFAEMEASLVRHLFQQASSAIAPLEQENCTQSAILAALAQPRHCFHFAGHGTYDRNNPAQSCLFLKEADQLTLIDIVALDLKSYQLVSLAACETGMTGNQTITDEYVGLVSAYLKAGARFVLSTLWPIESLPSTLLITKFYEELLIESQPPARALKQAQLFLRESSQTDFITWLQSYRNETPDSRLRFLLNQAIRQLELNTMEHPYADAYFWSPFILSGR